MPEISDDTSSVAAQSGDRRPELDGLRAVAVLATVWFHALTSPVTHGPYAGWVGLGARGVDLFFVLSGFCLSWPYAPGAMRSVRDMGTFFARRLTRIVPTCWAAIALFGVLAFTPFGLPLSSGARVSLSDQLVDLARDAAMFPTLSPYHDNALWTLGLEMRWYLLFPILLVVFFRSKVLFVGIAFGAFVLNRFVALPDAGILPAFMSGVVAAAIAKRVRNASPYAPVIAFLALAIAIVEQCSLTYVEHDDAVWQLACFGVVLAVVTSPSLRRALSAKPLVGIGIASYSIYLIHQPIIGSLAWAGVSAALAAALSIGFGIVFWYVVERRLMSRAAREVMLRALRSPGSIVWLSRRPVEQKDPTPAADSA